MSYDYDDEYQGSTALVPLNDAARVALCKMEPELSMFPDMIDQMFHMQLNKKTGKFKLVIDKAGLNWKMDRIYRGKYNLETKIVMGEEYSFVKTNLLGYTHDTPGVIIMKAFLTLERPDGKEKVFTAYGTATPDNVKKKKNGQSSNAHLIELAETRAEKRVLQKVTGCGFAVSDDDYEENNEELAHDLHEQARKRMWVLLKDNGYIDRDARLGVMSQILQRQVETSKTLTYADILKINAILERPAGSVSAPINIIDGDYKAEDITPPPEQKLSAEQLSRISNLFIELKWDIEKQNQYFTALREKNSEFTAKTATDLNPKSADKIISMLCKRVNDLARNTTPPPPENPPEKPNVKATQAQLQDIEELYKALEWDWMKKKTWFENYRERTGEHWVKSPKDMDTIKADLFINYLQEQVKEKQEMEQGPTEEEMEQMKQDVKANTIHPEEIDASKEEDYSDVPF